MNKRTSFRPTALDLGPLEERVVLSHVGVSAEVAAHAVTLAATFRGRIVTTNPPAGEAGASQTANLSGNARIPRLGPARLNGHLASNGSLPPPFSSTSGEVTLTSGSRKAAGTVVLSLVGPPTDLASKTRTSTNFTFVVKSATGIFSQYVGDEGSAVLTLQTRPRPRSTTSVGNFGLTLSIVVP